MSGLALFGAGFILGAVCIVVLAALVIGGDE